MRLKYQFVTQKVGNQIAAVAVGEGASNFNGLLKLNETAAFIIEQLANEVSREELVNRLSCEFPEVDQSTLASDLDGILGALRESDLLVD